MHEKSGLEKFKNFFQKTLLLVANCYVFICVVAGSN